ncbi:MAG: ATP-binding cassette domain-containing protein [Planctomycetota bacterium]|jgi:ABC-type ATPase with predicted acetyltransferase domain
MPTYSVSKSFNWQGTVTDKVASVCRMFGLTIDRLTERKVSYNCQIQINPGDILFISGPSGAGKSVLLRELEKSIPSSDRINLDRIKLPDDKTLIDCIDADLLDSLKMLSSAGLNDCFCILNQPRNLSDGQKYRFRLAMALAANKKFIFADEFCSELDRITAAVISYNIYKYAKCTATIFILASSHNDILLDLSPDVLISTELSGTTEVIYKRARK